MILVKNPISGDVYGIQGNFATEPLSTDDYLTHGELDVDKLADLNFEVATQDEPAYFDALVPLFPNAAWDDINAALSADKPHGLRAPNA